MRISLAEPKGSRKRPRRRGRRRLRTFESSFVQPQAQQQQNSKPARAAERRSGAPVKPSGDLASTPPQLATKRRSRWRTVGLRILATSVLVVLVGGIVHLSAAKRFFVYDAEIVGNHHIARDRIYQEAGIDEMNVFWINPKKAAQRIEKLDGIKGARVGFGLPARVRIEVEERKPVMLWRVGPNGEGGDWWLDEEGVVLPYHGVLADAVFMIDKSGRGLQSGDRVEPQDIVTSVQQLAAALPEVEVFWHQPDRGLSFNQSTSFGQWTVFFGDSKDLVRKIEVLQAVTAHLKAEGIRARYVDVRWPDHPVYGDASGKAIRGRD